MSLLEVAHPSGAAWWRGSSLQFLLSQCYNLQDVRGRPRGAVRRGRQPRTAYGLYLTRVPTQSRYSISSIAGCGLQQGVPSR